MPIAAEANLSLTKQPSITTPTAGTSFTWTLVAHNNGPSDAAGPLTVTDTLPPYQTYLSAAAPWDCTPGPRANRPHRQQTVTCTLDSGLAVNTDTEPLHDTGPAVCGRPGRKLKPTRPPSPHPHPAIPARAVAPSKCNARPD